MKLMFSNGENVRQLTKMVMPDQISLMSVILTTQLEGCEILTTGEGGYLFTVPYSRGRQALMPAVRVQSQVSHLCMGNWIRLRREAASQAPW